MRDARHTDKPDGPGTTAYVTGIQDMYMPATDPNAVLVPDTPLAANPVLYQALIKVKLKKGKDSNPMDAYLGISSQKPNPSEVCGIFQASLDLNPANSRHMPFCKTVLRWMARTGCKSDHPEFFQPMRGWVDAALLQMWKSEATSGVTMPFLFLWDQQGSLGASHPSGSPCHAHPVGRLQHLRG